jgi:hypothetical protein
MLMLGQGGENYCMNNVGSCGSIEPVNRQGSTINGSLLSVSLLRMVADMMIE